MAGQPFSLNDVECPTCRDEPKDPEWHLRLKIEKTELDEHFPIYLALEPSKFVINPEKGTQFTIKSLSTRPQDVIVTCNSYLFEIKNARAYKKTESQIFQRMKKDEIMKFTIGMKEEDIAREDIAEKYECFKPLKPMPRFAAGFIDIHHYRTVEKKEITDPGWASDGMVQPCIYDGDGYGHWKDSLRAEFYNDKVIKREAEFAEKHFKNLEERSLHDVLSFYDQHRMMMQKDPEQVKYVEEEWSPREKIKPSYSGTKKTEEKKQKKEKKDKKKKKKKCVIM